MSEFTLQFPGEIKGRSRYIPLAVQKAVMQRDNHECHYCGRLSRLTFDHKWAFIFGGEQTVENLVVACKPCNTSKGTRSYDDFKEGSCKIDRRRPKSAAKPKGRPRWTPKAPEFPMAYLRQLVARIDIP